MTTPNIPEIRKRAEALFELADDLFSCIATIKDVHPAYFTPQLKEAYDGYAKAANELPHQEISTYFSEVERLEREVADLKRALFAITQTFDKRTIYEIAQTALHADQTDTEAHE